MRAIMNICVSSLACLSFSLRPPPPSPRLLSSSVVFEMLRGSLNSVSVSGCMRRLEFHPPGEIHDANGGEAPSIIILERVIYYSELGCE